ncbi:hypothetical protein [Nocardiopsis mwathae]|uniref:hypothetical protein n=1 Tax=Nocardiopsis mwathae TaxID=1472723 RepID=UPI0031B57FE7
MDITEELTRLTGGGGPACDGDDCPNVYVTRHGTFVVQGDQYRSLEVPKGEGAVEIPESVLREAVRVLGW